MRLIRVDEVDNGYSKRRLSAKEYLLSTSSTLINLINKKTKTQSLALLVEIP
jgi:hypothetical protein